MKDQDILRTARELIKFYGGAASAEALHRAAEAMKEGKPGIAAVWEQVGHAVEGELRGRHPGN